MKKQYLQTVKKVDHLPLQPGKSEFLKNGAYIFGKEKASQEKKEDVGSLYKVIGQQKIDIELRSNS